MEAHPEKNAAGKIDNNLDISLFECIPIPLFVINKEHRIAFWNKACEELTGFTAKEMEGTRKEISDWIFGVLLKDETLDESTTFLQLREIK